ncbi:MAG: oligosaccharide flippase family protein [Pirellulales bacterium]
MGLGNAAEFLRGYWTTAGRVAATNFLALMAAAAVGQVCGLATVVLLTKFLGAQQFGVYMSAVSLQFYLAPLGSGGLAALVVREIARQPNDSARLASAYYAITLFLSVVVAVLLACFAWIRDIDGGECWLLVFVGIGNVGTCASASPFLDLHHRQRRAALIGGIIEVVALLLLVVLIRTSQLSLGTAGALLAIKYCLLSATTAIVASRGGDLSWGRFSWRDVATLFRGAPSMVLASLAATIPITSGTFWVREFHGDAAAGVMGLGAIFLNLIGLFAVQMQRILLPHMVGEHGRDRVFVRRLVLAYGAFLTALGFGALVGVWGFSRFVLSNEYASLATLGSWLILGGLGLAACWLATGYLIVLRRESLVLYAQVLAAAVFSGLAWWLTPKQGVMGITWAVAGAAISLAIVAVGGLRRVWGDSSEPQRVQTATKNSGSPVQGDAMTA